MASLKPVTEADITKQQHTEIQATVDEKLQREAARLAQSYNKHFKEADRIFGELNKVSSITPKAFKEFSGALGKLTKTFSKIQYEIVHNPQAGFLKPISTYVNYRKQRKQLTQFEQTYLTKQSFVSAQSATQKAGQLLAAEKQSNINTLSKIIAKGPTTAGFMGLASTSGMQKAQSINANQNWANYLSQLKSASQQAAAQQKVQNMQASTMFGNFGNFFGGMAPNIKARMATQSMVAGMPMAYSNATQMAKNKINMAAWRQKYNNYYGVSGQGGGGGMGGNGAIGSYLLGGVSALGAYEIAREAIKMPLAINRAISRPLPIEEDVAKAGRITGNSTSSLLSKFNNGAVDSFTVSNSLANLGFYDAGMVGRTISNYGSPVGPMNALMASAKLSQGKFTGFQNAEDWAGFLGSLASTGVNTTGKMMGTADVLTKAIAKGTALSLPPKATFENMETILRSMASSQGIIMSASQLANLAIKGASSAIPTMRNATAIAGASAAFGGQLGNLYGQPFQSSLYLSFLKSSTGSINPTGSQLAKAMSKGFGYHMTPAQIKYQNAMRFMDPFATMQMLTSTGLNPLNFGDIEYKELYKMYKSSGYSNSAAKAMATRMVGVTVPESARTYFYSGRGLGKGAARGTPGLMTPEPGILGVDIKKNFDAILNGSFNVTGGGAALLGLTRANKAADIGFSIEANRIAVTTIGGAALSFKEGAAKFFDGVNNFVSGISAVAVESALGAPAMLGVGPYGGGLPTGSTRISPYAHSVGGSVHVVSPHASTTSPSVPAGVPALPPSIGGP